MLKKFLQRIKDKRKAQKYSQLDEFVNFEIKKINGFLPGSKEIDYISAVQLIKHKIPAKLQELQISISRSQYNMYRDMILQDFFRKCIADLRYYVDQFNISSVNNILELGRKVVGATKHLIGLRNLDYFPNLKSQMMNLARAVQSHYQYTVLAAAEKIRANIKSRAIFADSYNVTSDDISFLQLTNMVSSSLCQEFNHYIGVKTKIDVEKIAIPVKDQGTNFKTFMKTIINKVEQKIPFEPQFEGSVFIYS